MRHYLYTKTTKTSQKKTTNTPYEQSQKSACVCVCVCFQRHIPIRNDYSSDLCAQPPSLDLPSSPQAFSSLLSCTGSCIFVNYPIIFMEPMSYSNFLRYNILTTFMFQNFSLLPHFTARYRINLEITFLQDFEDIILLLLSNARHFQSFICSIPESFQDLPLFLV